MLTPIMSIKYSYISKYQFSKLTGIKECDIPEERAGAPGEAFLPDVARDDKHAASVTE